jgi:hypothetical protein
MPRIGTAFGGKGHRIGRFFPKKPKNGTLVEKPRFCAQSAASLRFALRPLGRGLNKT